MMKNLRIKAFSLVEVMVAMAIVGMILLMTGQMISGTGQVYRKTQSAATQFREARRAFEAISRQLSQATLNTYWDYERDATGNPVAYFRQSELHFVTGPAVDLIGGDRALFGHSVFFHAPLGQTEGDQAANVGSRPPRQLSALMNSCGFFVEHGGEINVPPHVESASWFEPTSRFRLLKLEIPTEKVRIYEEGRQKDTIPDITQFTNRDQIYRWFRAPLARDELTSEVARNILALIISPQIPSRDAVAAGKNPWEIAPDYLFDSREKQWGSPNDERVKSSSNQLPPVIQLALIALDETSAQKLADSNQGGVPNLGIDGLFLKAENFEDDLKTLEANLRKEGLNHRVFSAAIPIRTAKWSE